MALCYFVASVNLRVVVELPQNQYILATKMCPSRPTDQENIVEDVSGTMSPLRLHTGCVSSVKTPVKSRNKTKIQSYTVRLKKAEKRKEQHEIDSSQRKSVFRVKIPQKYTTQAKFLQGGETIYNKVFFKSKNITFDNVKRLWERKYCFAETKFDSKSVKEWRSIKNLRIYVIINRNSANTIQPKITPFM